MASEARLVRAAFCLASTGSAHAQARFTERPGPHLPSYTELEGYERICRWLDAQPHRRGRLPFVGLSAQTGAESEVPTVLLAGMRTQRIVRHTNSCEWALSPTWQERLQTLWKGIERTERERFVPQSSLALATPRMLAAGMDT